jgi:murein DD-endopeptidase MepM/ murein hydrolase activator NlpD
MQSGKDDPPSYDPRTWRGSFEALAQGPADGSTAASASPAGTSFDPKSWTGPATVSPAEPRPARTGAGWRMAAVGLAVAILVAAAAGGIVRHRRAPQPAMPASAPRAQAVAPHAQGAVPGSSRRTLVLADPGQVAPTIAAIGLAPAAAEAVTAQLLAALGPAPGEIRLSYETAGAAPARLLAAEATRSDGAGVALAAAADGRFDAQKLVASLSRPLRAVSGQMDQTNFYSSAVTAGIDDSLISDFAKALAFDFNFQTEIHAGDVFGAVIERAVNAAGEPVGLPRLLYVSMRTETKVRSLYSFAPPGETEPAWFDANGRGASRALMRTPVDGARITSTFGPRFHPILHFMKMHKGIDFAAPTGTPIYASGSGVVLWAAMKGANGNLTKIRHDNGWETLYLHQSMFMPGVVPGARVSQGQKIGEIGTTGRSTGPHLHYEVHIGGVPVDPQSIDTGSGVSLSGEALARFRAERDRIDRARAAAQ